MRLFLILATISFNLFSPAVPQTGNSKIVFSSNREGSYQIYVMNSDGSGVVRLTNSGANDDLPRWSPNGTKILFQSDRDHLDTGYMDIYAMNADGTGVTRLTSDVNDDSMAAWSPDGTKIAFQSRRNGLNYQVYSMNADGSNLVNLSNSSSSDDEPSWSADGNKLVLSFLPIGEEMFSIAKAQADPIEKIIEIRLDIPSAELLSKPGDKPYRVGEKPYIKMTVKNQSDHQIRVRVIDSFYQNRPRLFKNGHLVPYRKGIPALINSKDTDPNFMRGGGAIELAPYSSADLPEVDLSDWYGALQPGVYQLVNRYRPEMYGQWTADCEQLVFEVVKRQ